MSERDHIHMLLRRLGNACTRRGWQGDLWARGVEKIENKFCISIFLSKFTPCDMNGELTPTAQIQIWIPSVGEQP